MTEPPMTEPPPGARTAPSAARNREPILAVLREWLPATGLMLEIAAGSGEHALWFSRAFPDLTWRPTDRDEAALQSIAAWRAAEGPANLMAPQPLNAAEPESWPVQAADAMLSVNMIHIAPWSVAQGLMAGAGRILSPGGVLVLYGPFREGGRDTAPSNADFDADLKRRDPSWGVRDLETVTALAEENGLTRAARIEMPANNLSVVFQRR